ncbi:MAG: type II toxin-antitoxin system RelE/ParE family toxin [Campylobacteraceae bacterium]|jgi:putative addiction module killer protein|nr:type II toxin-antitoxin system RelE/ParE family toxin [Campylobacteraceae bacterium]
MKVVESDIYLKWLSSLQDAKSQTLYQYKKRFNREHNDYFGNFKNLGDGVSELKVDKGAGYRVYYHIKDGKVYFLRGGDKSHQ